MPPPASRSPTNSHHANAALLMRRVGDGVLLADGATGSLEVVAEVVYLDARSKELLEQFATARSVTDVVAELSIRYSGTAASEVADDIDTLVTSLVERGLLVAGRREPHR